MQQSEIPATHSPFGASWVVFWSLFIQKEPEMPKTLLQVGHVQKVELYFTFLFLIFWPGLLLLLARFVFVCLFSFSFARHLLGFVTVVKIWKVFGKSLRIVRVNLTCFLAFSLASDSFGNGLKDLLHKRHIAHESTGVVTGSSGVLV